jgi:putative salt-induced outer membrane protein
MSKHLLVAAILAAPLPATAGEWSGEIAAGYLATTGNSSARALNAKAGLTYVSGPWKNALVASATNSSRQGASTGEAYFAGNKLDYGFTERDYLFFAVEWAKDLFGGIRERTSETVGYGRHLLLGPVHKLDAEIGGGLRQTEEQSSGEKHNDPIARAALIYGWKISETSALAQNVKAEYGASNTSIESATELKLMIIGTLAATLSYHVKHNTNVAPGIGRTDTQTVANLSYGFGSKD